jgi:pyruvyltransferase
MNISIFTIGGKNFGDAVNNIFWEKITNKKIIYKPNEIHYITTGSIMCLVKNNSIIFGTGFISEKGDLGGSNFRSIQNKKYVRPSKVISVRGPLSRNKLLAYGIQCPENYGDPLILMPCIYNKSSIITNVIIGIIPHYVDKNNNNLRILKKNLENKGYKVNIIDIEIGNNYQKIIDEINKCKYIISSSLHGVIMGLVYKKKTIFVEFSNKVVGNIFKFQDFFKSIKINYKNNNIYTHNLLKHIIPINYNNLTNMGLKLISLIPFIDNNRKEEISKIYKNFYS